MISLHIQKMPVRPFSQPTRTATPAHVSSQNVLHQNNTLPSYPRGLSFGCETRFGWVPTDEYEPGMAHVEYRGSGDLEEFVVGDFVDAKKIDMRVKEEIITGTDFKGTSVVSGKYAEFGDRSELQDLQTYGNLKTRNDVKIDSAWVSGDTTADNNVKISELHNVNNLTAGTEFQADKIWVGGDIELGDNSETRCLFAGGNVKLGSINELQEIHFVRNPDKKDSGYRKLEFESTDIAPESIRIYLGNIKKLDIFIKGLKNEEQVERFADEKLNFFYEPETPDSTKKLAKPDTAKARRLTESECQHIKMYGVR